MACYSIEILISLLKQHGIQKLVLSSGSRHIPFVSAVETDEAFECFSVVDERSAAFFALGVCQQSRAPVAVACTSGTAASNYLPGVTEAFYSHAPLVVITFDRDPRMLHQLETQKIDQPAIFESVCKKVVSLPVLRDEDDAWYCQRLVNEALIALRQGAGGPVCINVPVCGGQNELVDAAVHRQLAGPAQKIDYIRPEDGPAWRRMAGRLAKARRVLFVMGQMACVPPREKRALDRFFARFACPLLTDNLCNYRCAQTVFAESTIKALNAQTIRPLLPQIVVTFGCNFQERIKDLLKAHRGAFEHWSIEPDGVVKDVFKSQTALFHCTPAVFFETLCALCGDGPAPDGEYLARWRQLEAAAVLPALPFTNFFVVDAFAGAIPKGSVLHLSILNSTRLMQFYRLDPSIQVYSNVNAFGIDGCLPTFMGQAACTSAPAFLVIGDLSFFYGMNALAIRHRKNNIRILLINNGGGAEFHIMPDHHRLPTIDRHIGAAHSRTARGWAESMGYEYLCAGDVPSFLDALPGFVGGEHTAPVLFEVFTDLKTDGEQLLSVYRQLEKEIQPVLNSWEETS